MFNSSSPFYMKPRLDPEFLKWSWYFKKSSTKSKVQKAMPIIRDINLFSRELYEGIKASGDLGEFQLENKGLLMVYQTEKERDHEMEVAEKARELELEVHHLDKEGLRMVEPEIEFNAQGAIHYKCDRHTTPAINLWKGCWSTFPTVGVGIKKEEEVLDIDC